MKIALPPIRDTGAGEAASMCDITHRKGTNHGDVARHVKLTLLAPDIVVAILDATLPEGVQLLSPSDAVGGPATVACGHDPMTRAGEFQRHRWSL